MAIAVVTGNRKDDFLKAADRRRAGTQGFNCPAFGIRKMLIHLIQVACKKSGLVSAGTGTNFNNGRLVVIGVAGEKLNLELSFKFLKLRLVLSQFFARPVYQIRVFTRADNLRGFTDSLFVFASLLSGLQSIFNATSFGV